jgi:O-acetyl-ADP-ribose deacetylase (regulator of RNase III)
MRYTIVEGDLLDQPVDAIVNAWNRNVIPWWLLIPQGVSGAIKRRAGLAPFHELARVGPIPLGGAVLTGAGRLPYLGIVHVAGIDMLWRASRRSIAESVRSAISVARRCGFTTLAMPVIGSGSGGFTESEALAVIEGTLRDAERGPDITVVRFRRAHNRCGKRKDAGRPE